MRFLRTTAVAVACVAVGLMPARAAEEKAKLKKTFEKLLPGLGAAQNHEGAQQEWQKVCFQAGAPGREAQRAEVCRLMVEKLGPDTPARARVWLLTQLVRIGRGESVAPVAKLVTDPDVHVRDGAVRALANNPTREAGEALRAALASAGDAKARLALVHALGYRAEPESVAALAKLPGSGEAQVAGAAAAALGKVGTPEAAEALTAAAGSAQGTVKLEIDDARLLCADSMRRAGQNEAAMRVYRAVLDDRAAGAARRPALVGLLKGSGDRTVAVLVEALVGDDVGLRTVAVGHVRELNPAQVKELAESLGKVPPPARVAVLAALGSKRDRAALPAVLSLAGGEPGPVQAAAFKALGGLGDSSAVPLLLKTMAGGGEAGQAARETLQTLWDKGVDDRLVELARASKDAGQTMTYLDLLEGRASEAAVPLLVEVSAGTDAGLRRKSVNALGRLGGEGQVEAILKARLKATDRGEQDDAERAVLAVCDRMVVADRRGEPVLAFYAHAGDADKSTLLPLLGRFGGDKARGEIRAALASRDKERYANGLRGLCNWPDASVAADLLGLAQKAPEKGQRADSLRAFCRVIAVKDENLNNPKVALEKLALLKQAMPLVDRPEDRRMLIDQASFVRHVETVRWLLPFLVGVVGVGAVLLTRFGSRSYPIDEAAVSVTPPPGEATSVVEAVPVEPPETPSQPPADGQ